MEEAGKTTISRLLRIVAAVIGPSTFTKSGLPVMFPLPGQTLP